MEPRREDAGEQCGQKYQMHDSYLIAEISRCPHNNKAVNDGSRPIVAREVPCWGGGGGWGGRGREESFLHGSIQETLLGSDAAV